MGSVLSVRFPGETKAVSGATGFREGNVVYHAGCDTATAARRQPSGLHTHPPDLSLLSEQSHMGHQLMFPLTWGYEFAVLAVISTLAIFLFPAACGFFSRNWVLRRDFLAGPAKLSNVGLRAPQEVQCGEGHPQSSNIARTLSNALTGP